MNTFVTELEAREKWCPFTRYSGRLDSQTAANRWKQSAPPAEPHALNPVPCRCLGRDCMAWRWGRDESGDTAYHRTPVEGMPGHFDNVPMGYCGLAGAAS